MLDETAALQKILSGTAPLSRRLTPLREALHLFTVEPITARIPLPGFDNSAMDGYAVRAQDTQSQEPLRVISSIAAGAETVSGLEPHCAIRIFTGAPMPSGADAVIMQEDISTSDDGRSIVCLEPVAPGENVRLLGCDLCAGQRILEPGDRLTPACLAVLASQGLHEITTATLPRIAIVTTGDELVEPGSPLPPGCIYNSNATLLSGLVQQMVPGASLTLHHVPDDLAQTTTVLRELIEAQDFIIIAGGVSVGDHDHVKPALAVLGIHPEFWKVKVKPGKPLLFAPFADAGHHCRIFGLPGNPVSAFVTFQLFVRPALLKALGAGDRALALPQVNAVLTAPAKNPGDRPHYLRGHHEHGTFTPIGAQQSHALYGLSRANALLRLEPEQKLHSGDTAPILLCG